ncbi:MAG: prepilin-type N-terminal cleavage/methylation domain-containing protein [Dehalococcoidales bacterium]|nr:prepilin-type N-terminal cleavage/methylation domain-containing protein [Dehalococcoidales bacterium]
MFNKLGVIKRDQNGLTMIELLVAVAITALIMSGLTMIIFNIVSNNAQNSGQMTVLRQVQNSGHWISRDTLMAQEVYVTPGTGFPLTLTWINELADLDNPPIVYQVVYNYDSIGQRLTREYYEYPQGQPPVLVATTFIAEYLDSVNATFDGTKLVLSVSASLDGFRPVSESRTYEISPRPS